MDLPAKSLATAKLVLDRERAELQPYAPDDRDLYVERGEETYDDLLSEAESACVQDRPFRWFYTGHTGAGKSTELNRIVKSERLLEGYLPVVYRVRDSLDINDLDFTDLILAIGQAVSQIAKSAEVKIDPELAERIEKWGAETQIETEQELGGQAKGGIEWNLLFAKASAEIQAGGTKKTTIREKLRDQLTDFIALVDDLATDIEAKKRRRVLVVLDTLDHVDHHPIREIFTKHWASISRTRVSLLTVIPLPMINEPDFMARVEDNFSLLPNIRVHAKPGADKLDREGFAFFKEVIRRLAELDLFSDAALRDIFRLSGGMLRDMIGIAGDACKHADRENPNGKVSTAHVRRVLEDRMAYFHRLLLKKDYEVLRTVAANPHPLGFDGMGPLLHLKAILYFPNGRGWYALNPAVQAILDEAEPQG